MLRFNQILIAMTFLFGLPVAVSAATIDIGALVEWNCPGPATGGPATDASGDRLYLRVVDSRGNDLEVWCMQYGIWGRHRFEYWVSYRNGDKTKISECELMWGKNKNTITVNGNQGKTEGRVPGGGKSIRYKGRFGGFKHHNFNSTQDFHFTYDYATRKWHRYTTEKYRDSNGKKREKNTSFDDGQFSFISPPKDFLPDNHAFVANTFPVVASEQAQREAAGCEVALEIEYNDHIVASVSRLSGSQIRELHDVIYPSDISLQDIWFDEIDQTLMLSVSKENDRAEIDLIIPQGLLANHQEGDLSVTVDGITSEDFSQVINEKATLLNVKNALGVSLVAIGSNAKSKLKPEPKEKLYIWTFVAGVLFLMMVVFVVRSRVSTS